MTIIYERKLSMYVTVFSYNANGGTTFSNIPNMTGYQTTLGGNITLIQNLMPVQELKKKGIKDNKTDLKNDLVKKALDASKKVVAFAVFSNNSELKGEVRYTKSTLNSSADTILCDRCQVIHDKALANIANLGTYGITTAILTTLQTAINTFNTAIPKPRLGQIDTKNATAQLKVLFDETDAVLKKMDAMMEIVSSSNENYYNGYKNARIITAGGTGSIALKGTAIEASTENKLQNVKFVFTPETPEVFKTLHKGVKLNKKTAKKGSFYFKFLPEGNYTVTVSKNGYESKTLTVHVVNGETTKISVVMVKK